jgi:hypothetical protein
MRYAVLLVLMVSVGWAKPNPNNPPPWKRDGGVTEREDEWENCPKVSGLPPWRKCLKKTPAPAPAR